jgi:hypothetical protein
MGTNKYLNYSNLDGSTTFFFDSTGEQVIDETSYEPFNRDGCHGMRLFAESRGYTVNTNYNQLIFPNPLFSITHGFTYENYKAEIDTGRPVLLHVGDFTTIGIGYSDPDIILMYDTLSHSVQTMNWGGTYPTIIITVFQL